MIFQIGFNRRKLNGFLKQSHAERQDHHPYWMPEEVDDMNIMISRPSLHKHPVVGDALKIWPYKGLSSETVKLDRPIRDTRPFG